MGEGGAGGRASPGRPPRAGARGRPEAPGRPSAAAAPELRAPRPLGWAVPRRPESDFPLVASRLPCLSVCSGASAFRGVGEGPPRRLRCWLVLNRASVPAAPRPLRAGGRRGRRRPRSHGREGSAGEPGRTRRGPGPGALSRPPRRFAVPGDAAPRAHGLPGGAAAPWPTCDRAAFVYGGPAFGRSTRRRGPRRGGRGRDRGGGGGGAPRRPTPLRPRSHGRASASPPPGTLPGETGASPGAGTSR